MSFFGKFIGGTIGFLMGGPLGAIAGVAFAHVLQQSQEADRISGSSYFRNYNRRMNTTEHAHMTFFVGAFSLLAKLAKADGELTRNEEATIRRFMIEELRLDPTSQYTALRIFDAALSTNEDYTDIARQFYREFRNRPQILELMIDILFRVAIADGGVNKAEGSMILNIVRIFNFRQDQYDRIKERYVANTNKYYAVLNCKPEDDDETIKKSYRKLVRENHPDAIAAKGLPDEFQKVATDKFRQIQDAYEHIRKERGF
ncbi:TerB family tellurite resistance protein [Marispirochaeta sp.]|uniref:TerB family tellurite resistance protein n=1 Tax=Marispirochaeta sp. TaxID=2038653 RepID=UPI0029C8EB24|nr:TerB family tellurite resistance protein [Marispirochaeta sp.]